MPGGGPGPRIVVCSRCSTPRWFPAWGRRRRGPGVVPSGVFLGFGFRVGRQGVDPLGRARFPGFARLKLLAARAFELGVSGTVEWTLRLWAGLSSTPWFGTALEVEHQCQ